MNQTQFTTFQTQLQAVLPQLVTEILDYAPNEQVYGISFLTTDDFYGMYVAFETKEKIQALPIEEQTDYRYWGPNEWDYSDQKLKTSFNQELYTNLVAVVEANEEVNLMAPSPEKWAFALEFMQAIHEALATLPETLFTQHNYNKNDICFTTTMSDGDYMDEMLLEPAKLFNSAETSQPLIDYLSNLA